MSQYGMRLLVRRSISVGSSYSISTTGCFVDWRPIAPSVSGCLMGERFFTFWSCSAIVGLANVLRASPTGPMMRFEDTARFKDSGRLKVALRAAVRSDVVVWKSGIAPPLTDALTATTQVCKGGRAATPKCGASGGAGLVSRFEWGWCWRPAPKSIRWVPFARFFLLKLLKLIFLQRFEHA